MINRIIYLLWILVNTMSGFSQSGVSNNDIKPTVLGGKLENPYSVDNMRKAYANKRASVINFPKMDIRANHLYVRFLPKNEEELEKLYAHESEDFILFDHPLDYEIAEQGNFYHDPTIS